MADVVYPGLLVIACALGAVLGVCVLVALFRSQA